LCEVSGRLTPCAGLVSDLRQERTRIDETIQALLESRDILDRAISAAPPGA